MWMPARKQPKQTSRRVRLCEALTAKPRRTGFDASRNWCGAVTSQQRSFHGRVTCVLLSRWAISTIPARAPQSSCPTGVRTYHTVGGGCRPGEPLDYSIAFQLAKAIRQHLRRNSLDIDLKLGEAALAFTKIPDHICRPCARKQTCALIERTLGRGRRYLAFASLDH
jgi:hypothetical protein